MKGLWDLLPSVPLATGAGFPTPSILDDGLSSDSLNFTYHRACFFLAVYACMIDFFCLYAFSNHSLAAAHLQMFVPVFLCVLSRLLIVVL